MIVYKFSDSRTFFLSEYYILIPLGILVDYIIISKILSYKREKKELERLRKKLKHLERYHKSKDIVCIAFGIVTGLNYILKYRGGSDLALNSNQDIELVEETTPESSTSIRHVTQEITKITTDVARCAIKEGKSYLNYDRLRKIVFNLFKRKAQNGVIVITASALCHLAKIYGLSGPAWPIAIHNFGLTNLYETLRKVLVVTLFATVLPCYLMNTPVFAVVGSLASAFGLKLAYLNFDFIPTEGIPENVEIDSIRPRIADLPDVVSINYRYRTRIIMNGQEEASECWLPYYSFSNPKCNRVSLEQIKNLAEDGVINNGVIHNLNYNDVVNMQDVTGLDCSFDDELELGGVVKRVRRSMLRKKTKKTKVVNFLEKFADPKNIEESESWNLDENNITDAEIVGKKMNLRQRNTEL